MLRQRGAGASLSLRLESKLDEFGSHQMGPVVGMGVEAGGRVPGVSGNFICRRQRAY